MAPALTEKRPPSEVDHIAPPLIIGRTELMTQFIDSLGANYADVPPRWHRFSRFTRKLIQAHWPKSETSQRVLSRGNPHRAQDIGDTGGSADGHEALEQQWGIQFGDRQRPCLLEQIRPLVR